jgi:nicotinate-nucleotide adenylyltransferase
LTPTSEISRIGVFGGTFDPIHRGHLEVADECAAKLDLDPVLMVPSNIPPHREAPKAPAEERLLMVQLAVKGHSRLRASDVEVRRGGTSYMVDTLRILEQANPGAEMTLLLGWDAVAEFLSWRDTDAIPRLARIAVFTRSGSPPPQATLLARLGPASNTRLIEVNSPLISATSVRRILAAGGSAADLLPAAVAGYIKEKGSYQDASPSV